MHCTSDFCLLSAFLHVLAYIFVLLFGIFTSLLGSSYNECTKSVENAEVLEMCNQYCQPFFGEHYK